MLIRSALVFSVFLSTAAGAVDEPATAQHQDQHETQQGAVYGTEIEGQSVREVAAKIWQTDPNAIIAVPETESQTITNEGSLVIETGLATLPPTPSMSEPNPRPTSNSIQIQKPDSLNTMLIAFDYGYGNLVFFLSPKYTLVQAFSLVSANMVYLKYMELKLGRWSLLLQKGGRAFATGLEKIGLVSEVESKDRAERVGNFITHGVLVYAYYSLFQMMANMPNLHDGFFSIDAQLNALKITGSGFLSGFGWAMVGRKWDAQPDRERPISRQAFTTFNNARGLALGIFVPFLIGTPNNISLAEFAARNSPFLISAAVGTAFYLWGDPILERYPQIKQSLDRFEKLTQRLNEKLDSALNRIRNSSACSWFLKK